ncbi:MAG: phosphatase PAP2 family protein [Candidatus Scatosoma sp.]
MNSFYLKVYEKNRAFLSARKNLKKTVYLADKIATAALCLIYAAVCCYAIFYGEFLRSDALRVFVFPALCLALTSLIRVIVNEKRPYERGVTPLFEKTRKGRSFPSRHLSCAAVIAGIALRYVPVLGGVAAALTAVLFYARFACGWHFPRDLLCGVLLGAACALPAFFI